MNIFVTSPDPKESARNLDDRRVLKMIVESAQVLSTCMWVLGYEGPYKKTHMNHPCTIWARETSSNYQWLIDHFKALIQEYENRYPNKIHKCKALITIFEDFIPFVPIGTLTPFVNVSFYKDSDEDVCLLYQKTMVRKWITDKKPATWYSKTLPPFWLDIKDIE